MELPSRKVVKRSPARTVRLLNFPDLQNTAIECESSYERDFAKIASLFFATRSIQQQPFKMALANGRYTPDFLIRFQDGSATVVEVKPSAHIEKHAQRLEEARAGIEAAGFVFLVVDETIIQPDGLAKQARLIRRYAKTSFPAHECARALELVRCGGATLANLLSVHRLPRPLVFHLIALRQLACRTHRFTDSASELFDPSLIQQEYSHAVQFGSWLDAASRQENA